MNLTAAIVVVTFAVLLMAFTGLVFARPVLAERFLLLFASSARAHYTEQLCRVVVGTALVVVSPTMWQATVFRLVGWAIIASSVVLMLLPWRWHHGFGQRIRPAMLRYIRLYALGTFAFGVILLYGILAGAGAA